MNDDNIEKSALIDPDPLSVFLCILGAVGNFASIAAYVEYQREKREYERRIREEETKTRRELVDLFMSLEVEYIQLSAILKGIEVILVQGVSNKFELSDLQFQFGGMKPLFTYQGYKKYDESLLEANRKAGKIIEITNQILQRLYHYPTRIPPETLGRLLDFQSDLNFILRAQLNYYEAFKRYYEILLRGQLLSSELREILRKS